MSWDTEIVTMVRYYINDLSATPTYADDNLSVLILIASQQIQQEVNFPIHYVGSVDNITLKPDPTVGTNRDEAFIWLSTLKTCLILAASELKVAGGQAISIRDGSSAIDLRGTLEGKKQTLKWFKEEYAEAMWKYQLGIRPTGVGIFGPVSIITPGLYGQSSGFQTYAIRDRPLFS